MDANSVEVDQRAHFLGMSAKMMREILFDGARRRRAAKRGDGAVHVDLDAVAEVAAGETRDQC